VVDVSALRPYKTAVFDNERWSSFTPRPGDIFVCTPPKCGTTWTQTIIANLLWPDGDFPGTVMELSPWLEAHFNRREATFARLESQRHRRFVKSHTPADGIPFFPDSKYIFVGRDGRDAFMSFCHHREVFHPDLREELNARALEDGVPPMPPWDGDVHGFFAAWLAPGELFQHVASFWLRRAEPNLLLVHYNDLKADLAGEMRRIAEYLGIDVPAAKWPGAVERCTFESMKANGERVGSFWNFAGGAQSFLFKGTNGRWRDVLTPDELEAYRKRVAELLPPEAALWLERGRSAVSFR
jgi:aryl sulfotransferase